MHHTQDNTNDHPSRSAVGSIKNGIKTTEFWATILGSVLMAGLAELGIEVAQSAAISITTMVITYVMGRVFHKNKYRKST